jgi:hypothetical protein
MRRDQKDPLHIPRVRDDFDVRPWVRERAGYQSRIDPLTGGQRGERLSLDEAVEEGFHDA